MAIYSCQKSGSDHNFEAFREIRDLTHPYESSNSTKKKLSQNASLNFGGRPDREDSYLQKEASKLFKEFLEENP